MDYQGFKVIEPVGFFRGVAREALKGRWGVAFGAGFLYLILIQLPIAIFDSLFGTTIDPATIANMFGSGMDASAIEEIYGPDFALETTSAISGLYSLLTTGAFSLGISIFAIHILRRSEADAGMVFSGFGNYFRSLGVMVLVGLISVGVVIVFMIPMALLIMSDNISMIMLSFPLIFGMMAVIIVVSLMFGMVYFVLADNPKIGVGRCLGMSRRMMKGNKGKLFLLYLSFIGWGLLYYVFIIIVGLVTGVFEGGLVSGIISTVLIALGGGALSIYMLTSEAAFYEKVSGISSGMFNLSENIPNENPEQIKD